MGFHSCVRLFILSSNYAFISSPASSRLAIPSPPSLLRLPAQQSQPDISAPRPSNLLGQVQQHTAARVQVFIHRFFGEVKDFVIAGRLLVEEDGERGVVFAGFLPYACVERGWEGSVGCF